MVVKAWPAPDRDLVLRLPGRPAAGVRPGRLVARGQLLSEDPDPEGFDLTAPVAGQVAELHPGRLVLRPSPEGEAGGRPPAEIALATLHGAELAAALKRLGVPRPPRPWPDQRAVISALDPEPGLEAAGALWSDRRTTLQAGAEILARLWPGAEIWEVLPARAEPLGAGRVLRLGARFPSSLPALVKKAALGVHDPLARGVALPPVLWAMGAAARTGLPPGLVPATLQRSHYLLPPGLTLADALERVNLIPLHGDVVVIGGLIGGRPTARLDRGLDWSTGAVHLIRARQAPPPPGPCRRCGACRRACPLALPIDLLAARPLGDWPELAPRAGRALAGCLACGACALVCPAARPLTALALMARPRSPIRPGAGSGGSDESGRSGSSEGSDGSPGQFSLGGSSGRFRLAESSDRFGPGGSSGTGGQSHPGPRPPESPKFFADGLEPAQGIRP
jgi:electron transport complex protein RnfC